MNDTAFDPHKCRESLICMINKKVNKVVLITVACCIIGACGGFIIYGLAAEKKQNEHINQHHTQIKVIESGIKVIREDQKDIKKDQKELKKAVNRIEKNQLTESRLIDAIKEALKK